MTVRVKTPGPVLTIVSVTLPGSTVPLIRGVARVSSEEGARGNQPFFYDKLLHVRSTTLNKPHVKGSGGVSAEQVFSLEQLAT